MARGPYEARTRLYWVPSIANIAAPTVAELNAGTDLSCFITKDGVTEPNSQNMTPAAALCERFDAERVGSFGGQLTLKMYRDDVDADDDAYNLIVYGTVGFVVIRWGPTHATAWAAAQKVRVFPAEMHEPVMNDSAANTMATFNATMAVTGQPNLKATVA